MNKRTIANKRMTKRKRRPHPAKLRANRLTKKATRQKYTIAKQRQLWRFICIKRQWQSKTLSGCVCEG